MQTISIVKETFLHYVFKGVDLDSKDNPERAVEVLALNRDYTGEWETYWRLNHGHLIKVSKVVETLTMEDPVRTTISHLKEEMADIRARAEMEIKSRLDRINDLLMIGYEGGSAEVVDVEVKERSDDISL